MDVNNLFTDLLHAGLNYRYSAENWARVAQYPGHPYPSPSYEFQVNGQPAGIAELIQPPLKPVVITLRETQELEQLAKIYTRLIEQIFKALKLIKQNQLAFPTELEGVISFPEWRDFDYETGYRRVMPIIRLDCLKTERGFQVVDINTTRPAGVGDNIVLNHFFTQQSNRFQIEDLFIAMVSRCFRQWFATQSRWAAREILFLLADQYNDFANFEILAESINKRYGAIANVSDNADVATFRHDCIIRGRIKEGMPHHLKLEELRIFGQCIISPMHRRFLGSKIWPYLLAKNRLGIADMVPNELTRLTAGQVGLVTGEMVDFGNNSLNLSSLDHEHWLAKPINGSSGHGIVFGFQCSKNKWLRRVAQIPGRVVIEQYSPCSETLVVAGPNGEPTERELYTKYGVFILNGKLSGVEVMARPSPLVHGARDTYIGTCITPPK